MYGPRRWAELATLLSAALDGDAKPLYKQIADIVELDTSIKPQTAFAIDAVTCVDTPNLKKVKDKAVDEIVDEIALAWEGTSKMFATVEAGSCHHWPVTESERFVGPFNSTVCHLHRPCLTIAYAVHPRRI